MHCLYWKKWQSPGFADLLWLGAMWVCSYQPVVMLQEFIALFQPFCCHPALNVTSPHPQKGQNAFHFLVCICLFRTVSALLRYVAMKLLLGGEYH